MKTPPTCKSLTSKIEQLSSIPVDTVEGWVSVAMARCFVATMRAQSEHEWVKSHAFLVRSVTYCKHCKIKKEVYHG